MTYRRNMAAAAPPDLSECTLENTRSALPITRRKTYVGKPLNIHDGDTIMLAFVCDFGNAVRHPVRISRIDAPEISRTNAREMALGKRVRDYLAAIIGTKMVSAFVLKIEPYGRMLCDVKLDGIGDISDHLLTNGLVRFYDGRSKRDPWTADELNAVETALIKCEATLPKAGAAAPAAPALAPEAKAD